MPECYRYIQTGISKWDASDKGFDLTGTVTESGGFSFVHREQLSQSSEDLMRMEQGRKVGVVKFEASSKEEMSRERNRAFQATHGVGRQFTINQAEDKVKTNHNWMDKQISSRSEHREYAAPTSAPSTTMTALRTVSTSASQSLLGNAPSGSQLVSASTHTKFYFSPLADVTKTVKDWIESYNSDGSPNAAPILYRYSDEVKVNVTAWVEKIGNVFNGSSTLRLKSTFTESDQGTIETYRGLERQEGNSFNNWTVTYVPVETHTGGITQSITHTKPAADNTITIPNQGTQTTVEPGGEYHSGTSLLSTYRTVQDAIIGFIGGFTSFTSYVSLGAVDSSGSDGNTENGLSTEQETGRIDEIIDEFKRRYPTEGEYLKRYLKAGKIELAEMSFYNIHFKGAYDGTTRADGSDVIYIDPDTDIGLAADLLLQYLHVMQHYGNSKFSTEMNPKVDVETFLNNLHAAGVPLASGTRPYRVGMADLKLYNDMGVMAANLMPVVGTAIALSETYSGQSFAFVPEFVEELSPTQRVFTFATVAGPVLVAVAYKVGGKVLVRVVGAAGDTRSAKLLARGLFGHNEYKVINREVFERSKAAMFAFYKTYGPGTIEFVDETVLGSRNGMIDTETGVIYISKELRDRFPHLLDGTVLEERIHFHQIKTRGWFGRLLTPVEKAILEDEVVGRLWQSGLEIHN